MTIITKPLSEKKGDKLVVPLVENEELPSAPPIDVESQSNDILIIPARAHRVSSTTTLCLLLAALAVVGIGIYGGSYLYQQYLRVNHGAQHSKFEGWMQLPYNKDFLTAQNDLQNNLNEMLEKYKEKFPDMPEMEEDPLSSFQDDDYYKNYFREHFELDEDEQIEKINVPQFRDDRNGRFIHDFNTNITCIIDQQANRCFIMPLDRQNILPPKSLFDLIHKMWSGYYKIDTEVVRETMRVVTPPITDMTNIGQYITRECDEKKVYKLEKYVGGVVKRSADLNKEAKFAHFAGKGIIELDFVNMDEVNEFEKQLSSK